MDNRPRSPLLVTVNVTGACNLSCAYCYFRPRAATHMTLQDYRAVLAALRKAEVFLLTLSGGEPFLHPRIDELLRMAHAAFDHVSILTNGTAIHERHLATIREISERKGFFPIQISMDSVDPGINDRTRGLTALVRENLGKLKASGASITIAIVVSSLNVDRLRETIGSLLDVTQHFHVMPMKPIPHLNGADAHLQVPHERMRRAWEELIALRAEFGVRVRTPVDDLCNRVDTSAEGAPCMAGFTKLAIDPNLDVRPCDKCVAVVVGSLKTETLDAIWNGPRLAHVYQRPVSFCLGAAQRGGARTAKEGSRPARPHGVAPSDPTQIVIRVN